MTPGPGRTAPIEALGKLLAEAERLGVPLTLAHLMTQGLVPDTIEAGMAAQAAAVEAIGKAVAGWKVAIYGDAIAVAAPLLDVYLAEGDARVQIVKTGAKAIELELCFRLAEDIPAPAPGAPYTRDDLLAQIGSVHLGAELVGYRLVEENNVPFPLFLGDRLGNHSFVIGPELDRALLDLLAFGGGSPPDLHLEDRGGVLFHGAPRHPQSDPLAPLLACINSLTNSPAELRRDQIVTTGSLCGVIPVKNDALLDIRGGVSGSIRIAMILS